MWTSTFVDLFRLKQELDKYTFMIGGPDSEWGDESVGRIFIDSLGTHDATSRTENGSINGIKTGARVIEDIIYAISFV